MRSGRSQLRGPRSCGKDLARSASREIRGNIIQQSRLLRLDRTVSKTRKESFMASVRHLIVDGSSSSVDNGGAGTISYHTLYLPHATEETAQRSFATDGAGLPEMIARQAAVVAAVVSPEVV
jgi:hypothetical protein